MKEFIIENWPLALIIIFVLLYLLKPTCVNNRDERNSRDRYSATEELDEQIRRRKK